MKKQKLKTFLKLGILLFGISLFLVACQKDDDLQTNANLLPKKYSPFSITKIGEAEIFKNKVLSNKLNKLKTTINKNRTASLQNKMVYSSEYDFYINTDFANYIEVDSTYHSYTFNIYRDSITPNIENLLLSLQPDGNYKISLIKYNTTLQEKQDFSNGISINFSNNASATIINDDGISSGIFNKDIPCTTIFLEICGYNNPLHNGGYDSSNHQCPGYALAQQASFGCSAAAGSGGGSTGYGGTPIPDYGNPSTGNYGHGGAGGTGDTTNPNITVPTPCTRDCPEMFDYECSLSNEDFNAPYSANSPFNVDLSLVRDSCDNIDTSNVEANEKFMCIYNKLTASPSFKNLFTNTFGESKEMNVKIKVTDSLIIDGESVNGVCRRENYNLDSSGNLESIELQIEINSNLLSGSNSRTPFQIIKTILHEAIHAYLYVKILDCDQGSAIAQIDESKFENLIDLYFQNTCSQNQDQHDFMINFMLPTMIQILSEVKDSSIPDNQQEVLNGFDFLILSEASNGPLTENTIFNWSSLYHYLSLSGLHNTDAYNQIIPSNTVNSYLKSVYLAKLNTLSKNCYD
ncbi:hypothetical protein [Lacinutrix mariniflava]|uniref:hypothetical protein n=1 Tax=Lacinutrix mariniflava TaxID=342955 RepID=UPI0006E16E60|nr:hypothetical protein [Lacinutrix mariniflava]